MNSRKIKKPNITDTILLRIKSKTMNEETRIYTECLLSFSFRADHVCSDGCCCCCFYLSSIISIIVFSTIFNYYCTDLAIYCSHYRHLHHWPFRVNIISSKPISFRQFLNCNNKVCLQNSTSPSHLPH